MPWAEGNLEIMKRLLNLNYQFIFQRFLCCKHIQRFLFSLKKISVISLLANKILTANLQQSVKALPDMPSNLSPITSHLIPRSFSDFSQRAWEWGWMELNIKNSLYITRLFLIHVLKANLVLPVVGVSIQICLSQSPKKGRIYFPN